MRLDEEACYRALETRDRRFDGRFFTGVLSTGIYCRPICPARTPKRERCVFFPSAAAAQEAGYRPCLRCRPEASPGTPAWLGTSALVSRALRLIAEGALDDADAPALAARLGVGERHLRRLFLRHVGAPPLAVAQTRRLLFAKKLLDETALSMTEVALSSGFSSVRRFNDAIRATYARTPRELRTAASKRGGGAAGGAPDIALRLPFRPPLDWGALAGFLGARAIPGVESAGPGVYRRTVRVAGGHGVVEVRPAPGEPHLLARLRLPGTEGLIHCAERLRRLFDLGADPDAIAAHLRADPRLAPLVAATPGVRVPGAWDGFELAVRAILGQQVSVRAATQLAGRLVERHGEPLAARGGLPEGAEGLRFVFPSPEALAAADLTDLGVPRARAATITALAARVARGEVALDASRGLDETVRALCAVPGIGAWTAHYIAMRALREPDAFPATDLGLRRAPGGVSGADLLAMAEAWRPWRAYAAMLLWTADAQGARPAERENSNGSLAG
ncbi:MULTISPECIES: AlkA N-terminal domain-containing protein [Sorangium]|uniref:DNA-3-methyladenine glycosylase II n=1 Tax=Sorangium cellulosum TaxID=56 RepID=A0A4P2QZ75_SORCE|nr:MULTISPECIES: AlkA N-terminal domain-containing protein [Sorangium]AUX35616.1 DNA-3-methyladenine glycosylase [Sorangium cellulosum]WCQ94916.1 putative bifunctional transcriptional activator/DNA repair enzyme AlkA [Sorangium sp. Soce836]